MCVWSMIDVYQFVQSIYEPGKRHWLKVKKDYLAGGSMADTADLIVLGAYYGTGNKGWSVDLTSTVSVIEAWGGSYM